jgi:hypothetical protein
VDCPVLVLYGRRDRMIKKIFIENLPALMSDAQVIYHDEGGHHLMNDEPQFVVDEVKKFLGVPQLTLITCNLLFLRRKSVYPRMIVIFPLCHFVWLFQNFVYLWS